MPCIRQKNLKTSLRFPCLSLNLKESVSSQETLLHTINCQVLGGLGKLWRTRSESSVNSWMNFSPCVDIKLCCMREP